MLVLVVPVFERGLQRRYSRWRLLSVLRSLVRFRFAGTPVASGTIQVLQTGIQTFAHLIAGISNDSVYLGDEISTLTRSCSVVRVMTFSAPTTLAQTQLVIRPVHGGEIKGGAGNDTVFVTLSATSATD